MGESHPMNDDQVLVDRARKGDLDAFDALVARHQAGLVRYLTMMLSRPADAEDVAQEALLRAYRALKDFRGQSAFRTWLYQIAGNAARTHLERRRTRQEDQPAADEVFDVPSGESLERRLEAQNAVRWALAQLPEDWREAVVLRDIEGLDYKEIAQALGVPMGTVESRIFRGRQRLRELLTDRGTQR